MTLTTTREQRRRLARENAKQPAAMAAVPRNEWPASAPTNVMLVWRSREFLAQLYMDGCTCRLSVNKTTVSGDRWEGGITWDELMRIKRECGFGDRWAVECFPPDTDVVNVANQRHLWLLDSPPSFGWHRSKRESE